MEVSTYATLWFAERQQICNMYQTDLSVLCRFGIGIFNLVA
jgi:hypothetical protein